MGAHYPLTARIHSIDRVRGVVMLLMALDHIRDLMHIGSLSGDPTDLSSTTPALFLTRWVTHLCAPTFVLLSGVSAYLLLRKRRDAGTARRFLITRGLWLVVLEFTLVNFGIWFDVHFNIFLMQVIASIGLGFIALGVFLAANPKAFGVFGLAIIALHNLFPLIPFSDGSMLKQLLSSLFAPGLIPLGENHTLLVGYPPIPWIAILFVGFWCGRWFECPRLDRRRLFAVVGMVCIGLFIGLRALNIYGDPVPWSGQKNGLFTFLSFINITKYPPSLLFDLLMLGWMFLLLSLAECAGNRMTAVLEIYGRVPLFYYLLHWYLIHPLLFMVLFVQGFSPADFEFGFGFGRPQATSGLELWAVYLLWLGVIGVLYPICRWYGAYKQRNPDVKWLSYL